MEGNTYSPKICLLARFGKGKNSYRFQEDGEWGGGEKHEVEGPEETPLAVWSVICDDQSGPHNVSD